MAIFTAIATAIVGAIGVTGLVATIATSVISAGLALGTAKLLGVFEPPKMKGGSSASQKDPGVKIQLPPATDNKVPRMYGRNYTGGIITDAQIANQNKTMYYCLTISEYNDEDDWSVLSIYRDDALLNFTDENVISITDPNSTTGASVANKMRCRVYAGGSGSAYQIFPTTGAVNAYDVMPGWTSSHSMEDLVFAIFEMDYDSENGLTGLGTITFELNNSLNNPANVLLDYLQNDRYGAGLSNAYIDTDSFDVWRDYSSANVDYVDTSNATVQHSRYQIDGALSMFDSIKDNINKICQSGGAWFTYNSKMGKFGIVPNAPASNTTLANAFVFNDDNIISSISIGSTELFSLYNQIEVEYASVNQKDQTDVYFVEVPAGVRNPNEPDNKLDYRLHMVNDASRVATLANIDLNQSRFNTVLQFTSDFSAMQVDTGDVVKVTSELYGWTDKLFRVMRTVEKEDEEGVLSVDLTLLEYSLSVYDDIIGVEDLPKANSGIANWWVRNSSATVALGNIVVVSDPLSNANIHNPSNGAVISTITPANIITTYGGSVYSSDVFVTIPIDVPANTNFTTARVLVNNQDVANSVPITFTQVHGSGNSAFTGGETFNFNINTFNFDNDTNVSFTVDMFDNQRNTASLKTTTGNILIPGTANVITSTYLVAGSVADLVSGIFPQVNWDVSEIGDEYLLLGADWFSIPSASLGKYTFNMQAYPTGSWPANTLLTGRCVAVTTVLYPVANVIPYFPGGYTYTTGNIFTTAGQTPIVQNNVSGLGYSVVHYKAGGRFQNTPNLQTIVGANTVDLFSPATEMMVLFYGGHDAPDTIDGNRGMGGMYYSLLRVARPGITKQDDISYNDGTQAYFESYIETNWFDNGNIIP